MRRHYNLKQERSQCAFCRKSPLLAQKTRERWGTLMFHCLRWATGPWYSGNAPALLALYVGVERVVDGKLAG
jgi:hypothetical protein